MALNKDTLGQALYDVRQSFNNKTFAELESEFGNISAARLAMCKAEAEVIIEHFRANADGVYQTGSLIAGPNPVTKVGAVVAAVKIN